MIKLKQEKGGKHVLIYDAETDHQMRGSHPKGSGGSHTEGLPTHGTNVKTGSSNHHGKQGMISLNKMKDQVDGAVNVVKGAFGSLLDTVSGGHGNGSDGSNSDTVVADPLYLNIVTGLEPNAVDEEDFDFKFRVLLILLILIYIFIVLK